MAPNDRLSRLQPVLLQDLADLDNRFLRIGSERALSTNIAIFGLLVMALCYEAYNCAKFDHA